MLSRLLRRKDQRNSPTPRRCPPRAPDHRQYRRATRGVLATGSLTPWGFPVRRHEESRGRCRPRTARTGSHSFGGPSPSGSGSALPQGLTPTKWARVLRGDREVLLSGRPRRGDPVGQPLDPGQGLGAALAARRPARDRAGRAPGPRMLSQRTRERRCDRARHWPRHRLVAGRHTAGARTGIDGGAHRYPSLIRFAARRAAADSDHPHAAKLAGCGCELPASRPRQRQRQRPTAAGEPGGVLLRERHRAKAGGWAVLLR